MGRLPGKLALKEIRMPNPEPALAQKKKKQRSEATRDCLEAGQQEAKEPRAKKSLPPHKTQSLTSIVLISLGGHATR